MDVYAVSWKCLVPEGKNLARASRLRTWTAKSPASIIVQPSFVFRFEFGGSVTGGEDWSNLVVNAIHALEAPEIRMPDGFPYRFTNNAYHRFNRTTTFCPFLYLQNRVGLDGDK